MDTKCRECEEFETFGKDGLCIRCRREGRGILRPVRYTYEVKYWTPEQAEAMSVWPPREG
jgi:hypothetical protein